MAKRSRRAVSEGQDARSERPATGMGSPERRHGAGPRTATVSRSRRRDGGDGAKASERPATGMGSPESSANQEGTQVDNLCYEES